MRALVVLVALAAAALVFGVGQPAGAANSATYSDPYGDGTLGVGAGVDITTVTVSNNDNGLLTIRVFMPEDRYLLTGTFLSINFDTDQNPRTGDLDGDDYGVWINGEFDTAILYRWVGGDWQRADTSGGSGWDWDYGPTVRLPLRDIGNPQGFNFDIGVSWTASSGSSYYDFAPDPGYHWNYQIRGAPPAPPPTPPPPPPPTPPEPELHMRPTAGGAWAYSAPVVAYSGGRVVVHYVTGGQDAPPAGDADQDGTPDYVEEIAEAADTALAQFERLGFKAPLPDTGGPDARPDLYVKRPGEGILGLAVSYRHADGGSFLLIHPDLDTTADAVEDLGLRTTVAHELFHLVQYAYTPGGELPAWIAEGTASAAEAIAYPDLGETLWFRHVGGWLGEPWRPMHDEALNCERCYGGALWWLTLHQDDPGLLPVYFERLELLTRLDRPYGVGTEVLNTIIGQRANIARAGPGAGPLTLNIGEFDSLHGALAEFAEGIYRGGLRPGTLRQVKPRKKPRTARSTQLAGFSIHYLPVRVQPGARQLKITVRTTRGRPADVRLVIGGPNGRTITPPTTGRRQTLTVRLRNRKERRTVTLIITSGYQNTTAYQITHRVFAAKRRR